VSLNPTVKGVLDNVLGSSLVARDRYPGGGFMDEIPRWENPMTGKLEPIPGHQADLPAPAPGWGHHPMPPAPAPGWGHHPRPSFAPIGTADINNPGKIAPIGTVRSPSYRVPLGFIEEAQARIRNSHHPGSFETMELNTNKHGFPNPDGTWGTRETLPWDGTPSPIQLL